MPDSAVGKPLTLCVQDYVSRLEKVSRAPASDVRHLLAACLGCSAAEIRPVVTVLPQQLARFKQLFARCEQGEPLAYVLGEWDFWGLTLKLQQGVLIPRADTECLVEAVLARCDSKAELRVLDCGTGCGAVALALATECPSWFVQGVDKQPACVTCAKENAQHLGLSATQIVFVESDWEALTLDDHLRFDVLVANPPYIAEDDLEVDQQVHRYEPHEALYSPDSGYAHLLSLMTLAQRIVRPGGQVFFEHGYQQGAGVRDALQQHGFVSVATRNDYSGKERVTVASLPG